MVLLAHGEISLKFQRIILYRSVCHPLAHPPPFQDQYQVALQEQRSNVAQNIFDRYLIEKSDTNVLEVVPADLVSKCNQAISSSGGIAKDSKEVFAGCVKSVKDFLSGVPFKEFEDSMYFHRYLQWKWLEGSVIKAISF